MTFLEFIAFSRLHFLGLNLMVYAIGLAFARRDSVAFDPITAFIGLMIMLLVQLTTGYINEHFDQETDRVNRQRTAFTGGSGVAIQGRFALHAGLTALGLSVILVVLIILAGQVSAAAFVIYICAGFVSFAYTAPPVKLVWRGLGEITTGLTIAFLVPFWAYSLQGGQINATLVLTCLPFALLVTAMMLVIATPDYPADMAVGKHTLVVRLGHKNTARLYGLLLLAAYIGVVLTGFIGFPWVGVVSIVFTIPLALYAWHQVRVNHSNPIHIPRMVISAATLSGTIGLLAFLSLLFT